MTEKALPTSRSFDVMGERATMPMARKCRSRRSVSYLAESRQREEELDQHQEGHFCGDFAPKS